MFTAASVDRMLQCPPGLPMMMDNNRTWKAHIELAPNCPRCASSNTKFCYYNNYSLSQPRYFCKGCRRYWTKGGSLRNVPVGGGCRKNRRGKSVRLSQAERASLTYFHQNSSSTDDSSEHSNVQQGGTNGSDIDLAVVFANFLNHNNSSHDDHDHDHHPNLLVSSELMHDEEGNALSDQSQISSKAADSDQCQLMKPAHDDDLVEVAVAQLLEGVLAPNHHDHDHQQLQVEENIIQNFMGNHHHDHHDHMNHEFGLQGLLGDEDDQVVEDVFWSDAAAAATLTSSSSTSFTWQELDSFPSHVDDHIKISTKNVCNDNWSSFDFSGFEVFSRS